MGFFEWLAAISQSTAPLGQPFAPPWLYVALALVIPGIIGLALALVMNIIEKFWGIKLGGGSV